MRESSQSLYSKYKTEIIAVLLGVLAIVGYMNDISDFYNNYIKQKRAEDGLLLLNTGVSIQHVTNVFGAPIVENQRKDATEYVYSFKNFYLQVNFDKKNEVFFFAVTSKNAVFKPKIPYINKSLGQTFYQISNHYQTNFANESSKFYEYHESIYLGNFGNYRNIYLAYNPAGVEYPNSGGYIERKDMPHPSREASDSYRQTAMPNTFAVGEMYGEPDGRETSFGIGIEYFTSRDLPEHTF
ncbi:ETEC_3214 domain-containing protein [Photobacterium leiognathi]|uniref:ETEC_3214 domain-containing protein n=1 Tax=Photobacterium leiognathi TaxID=553611 RepID=UPI002981BB6C|nr:ETEC_3214 domain-containing protein [Photobacterium leiognathi]